MSQNPKMSVERVDPFVSEPDANIRFCYGVLAFLAAVGTFLFTILTVSAYQDRTTAGDIWGFFLAIAAFAAAVMIRFIYNALTTPDEE